jgi:hypothetical protein
MFNALPPCPRPQGGRSLPGISIPGRVIRSSSLFSARRADVRSPATAPPACRAHAPGQKGPLEVSAPHPCFCNNQNSARAIRVIQAGRYRALHAPRRAEPRQAGGLLEISRGQRPRIARASRTTTLKRSRKRQRKGGLQRLITKQTQLTVSLNETLTTHLRRCIGLAIAEALDIKKMTKRTRLKVRLHSSLPAVAGPSVPMSLRPPVPSSLRPSVLRVLW